MAMRGFRYYAIGATNTPQPVFGTTLSAAIAPDPNGAAISITVADSSMFKASDKIMMCGSGSDFTTRSESGIVVVSVVDSTHITAIIMAKHNSGDFVVLSMLCDEILVQGLDGSAGDYFFGVVPNFDNTLTATNGKGLIFVARKSPSGSQPPFFSSAQIYGMNPKNTNQFWIQGTQNDVFLPSFESV